MSDVVKIDLDKLDPADFGQNLIDVLRERGLEIVKTEELNILRFDATVPRAELRELIEALVEAGDDLASNLDAGYSDTPGRQRAWRNVVARVPAFDAQEARDA